MDRDTALRNTLTLGRVARHGAVATAKVSVNLGTDLLIWCYETAGKWRARRRRSA